MNFETCEIFGLQVARLDKASLDAALGEILEKGKGEQIVTLYSEYLVEAQDNPDLKQVLKEVEIVTADGAGVIWAGNFLEKAQGKDFATRFFYFWKEGLGLLFKTENSRRLFPERISGADFWLQVCAKCEEKNKKIFLVNIKNGLSNLNETEKALQKRFPKLKVEGDFSEEDLENKIQKASPDVIFCAFGMPKQDFFLHEILQKNPQVKLGIGIGGSFDFLTGKQKRAPKWMQKTGLEWLWRLISRPGRWRRIASATLGLGREVWHAAR